MTSDTIQSRDIFLEILFPGPFIIPQDLSGPLLDRLFALADSHQLFPFIYHRLGEAFTDDTDMPSCVAQFLEQRRAQYLNDVARSIKLEALGKEIIALLKSENYQGLVFKGTAIAGELYDDPGARASVDIDILVRQKDMTLIDHVLCNAGYEREGSLPLPYLFHRIQHATYRRKDRGVPVDVHWTFGVPWFFELDSDAIWKDVSANVDEGLQLSPDMLVVMLLMHHHLHFFRELRVLADLLRAFEKYGEAVDWKKFAERLRETGLLKTAGLVVHQLKCVWGERVDTVRGVQQLEEELSRLHVRVPQWLNAYFRMEIEPPDTQEYYRDKLYSRLLQDRWSTIAGSFFRTLFPPPAAIKALYNDERGEMLPVNYLRFIWWRVGDWMKQ